jgi:single-strand DNA-binding protein
MKSFNKVQLLGHIGSNPIIQEDESKTPFARVSLCTTITTPSGEVTTWHRLVAFKGLLPIMQSFVKGDKLYVEGSITNTSYIDQDGVKKYSSTIVIHHVHKVDRMRNNLNIQE